ncbi:MAG: phaC PHA synthase, partial [Myxococcales bacterium]|nr:phaC PHA synthase [Myxococcales bacterium]
MNIADGGTLLDVGGLNVSERSVVQVGFINVTKEITSFQFGFLNIAENGF